LQIFSPARKKKFNAKNLHFIFPASPRGVYADPDIRLDSSKEDQAPVVSNLELGLRKRFFGKIAEGVKAIKDLSAARLYSKGAGRGRRPSQTGPPPERRPRLRRWHASTNPVGPAPTIKTDALFKSRSIKRYDPRVYRNKPVGSSPQFKRPARVCYCATASGGANSI
jgi:hypothetical protein